jgi:hypothetical protein
MIVYRLRRKLRHSNREELATVRLRAHHRDEYALLELDGDPDFVESLTLDAIGGLHTIQTPEGTRTTPQELASSLRASFAQYQPELVEGAEVLQRRSPPRGTLAEQRTALADGIAAVLAMGAEIVRSGQGMAFANAGPQLAYVAFLWSHWRQQGGQADDPELARALAAALAESRLRLDDAAVAGALASLTTTLERDGEALDRARLRDDVVARLRAAGPA